MIPMWCLSEDESFHHYGWPLTALVTCSILTTFKLKEIIVHTKLQININ